MRVVYLTLAIGLALASDAASGAHVSGTEHGNDDAKMRRELSHVYNSSAFDVDAVTDPDVMNRIETTRTIMIIFGVILALACLGGCGLSAAEGGQENRASMCVPFFMCIGFVGLISASIPFAIANGEHTTKVSLYEFCWSINRPVDGASCGEELLQVHSICGGNFSIPTRKSNGEVENLGFHFLTSRWTSWTFTNSEEQFTGGMTIDCRSLDESFGGEVSMSCTRPTPENVNLLDDIDDSARNRFFSRNGCVRMCHPGQWLIAPISGVNLTLPTLLREGDQVRVPCAADDEASSESRYAVLRCGETALDSYADCCSASHQCCLGSMDGEQQQAADSTTLVGRVAETRVRAFNYSSLPPSLVSHLNTTTPNFAALVAADTATVSELPVVDAVPGWARNAGAMAPFNPCRSISRLLNARSIPGSNGTSALPLATCGAGQTWEAAFECTDTCPRPPGRFLIEIAAECSAHAACEAAGYVGTCCGSTLEEQGLEKCCCFQDYTELDDFETAMSRLIFWGCSVVGCLTLCFLCTVALGEDSLPEGLRFGNLFHEALTAPEVQSIGYRWYSNPIGRVVAMVCCLRCEGKKDRETGKDVMEECTPEICSPIILVFILVVLVVVILFTCTSFFAVIVLFLFLMISCFIYIFMAFLGRARRVGRSSSVAPEESAKVKKLKSFSKRAQAVAKAGAAAGIGQSLVLIIDTVSTGLSIIFETLIGSVVRVLFDVLLLHADLAFVLPSLGFTLPTFEIDIFVPNFFSWMPELPALPDILGWLGGTFDWLFSLRANLFSNANVQYEYTNHLFDIILLVSFLTVVLVLATPVHINLERCGLGISFDGLDILARLQYWRRTDKLGDLDKDGDGKVTCREIISALVVISWGALLRLLSSVLFAALQGFALLVRSALNQFIKNFSIEKHNEGGARISNSLTSDERMENIEREISTVYAEFFLLFVAVTLFFFWIGALGGAFHRTLVPGGSFLGVLITAPLQLWPLLNVVTVGRWGGSRAEERYALSVRATELIEAKFSGGDVETPFKRRAAMRAVKSATARWLSLLLQIVPFGSFVGKLSEYANEGELDLEDAKEWSLAFALAALRKVVGLAKYAFVIVAAILLETVDANTAGVIAVPAAMGLAFIGRVAEVFAEGGAGDDDDDNGENADGDSSQDAIEKQAPIEDEEAVEDEEVTPENVDDHLTKLIVALPGLLPTAVRAKMIEAARPHLEPKLKAPRLEKYGLTWDDVFPVLLLLDTAKEIRDAVRDFEGFLERLLEASSPLAVKLLLHQLRPAVEKHLPAPITWADVLPAFELIDTADELRGAIANPAEFLESLGNVSQRVAMRFLIAKARPKVEPLIVPLAWEDVLPALALIDSVEELKEAVAEPEAFLEKLAEAATPAAKRLLVAKAKPSLTNLMRKRGLPWDHVLKALELISSIEELKQTIAEPEAFLDNLEKLEKNVDDV